MTIKFQSALNWQEQKVGPVQEKVKRAQKKDGVESKATAKSSKNRGCEFCPMNELPGVNKVKNLDKVVGKKIMVWTQSPGESENRKKLELIGPAGKLLWEEGARVGLKREDCDIQQVVRCWPVSLNELDQIEPREPTKVEIHCCSIYTEEAIKRNQGKAKVHLVLGKVAMKSLLKGEYRKDQKTFYSKRLDAWVVCTFHPSYFLLGGPKSKKAEFREALETVVKKAGQDKGRFAYIDAQDYKAVKTKDLETELAGPLLLSASTGNRIVVDIEDDWEDGKNVVVYIGFSWKKGHSRGVFLNHPAVKQSREQREKKLLVIKGILEDPKIRKAMQYGSYDVAKLKTLLGIQVQGFDHDTMYSEYLRFSSRRAFGLEAIADVRFREFAGYKGVLEPYRDESEKMAHFLQVPPEVIVKYNGADCDLTKRIEQDNDKKISWPLLQVFIWASSVLSRMEGNGPRFDWEHDKVLQKWIPVRIEKLKARLRKMTKNEKFNPNAHGQVAEIIYDRLKLSGHLDPWWKKEHGERCTNRDTMQLLSSYHSFPGLINEYRKLSKKESTYMKGFRKSAELHEGRLRTIWWLTGTVTGRLRSGGAKDKTKGIVNLQNVHGDPAIENLLVSDLRWLDMYKEWGRGEEV